MKLLAVMSVLAALSCVRGADTAFDAVDQALTWASPSGQTRARLSGLLDLEGYALPTSAPGVIDAAGSALFVPRLTAFLDVQLGAHGYAFAQARIDRGFDPASEPLTARLDEYAWRWQPDRAGRFSLQIGKFATVVGNWTSRHDSWTNPFITAPLPYEHLTGMWDNQPPRSVNQLLVWAHVRPGLPAGDAEKYLRIPIIWGPSYTTGLAVAGQLQTWRYAFELKNAALSSRPDVWRPDATNWAHPTVSGRIRYVPDARWEFGWSASTGTFLRRDASEYLRPPRRLGDYQQTVLAQDASFAWHHVQVWAEVYGSRFQVPGIGNADTLAYYVETKLRLSPAFAAAMRWNQQLFGTLDERGRQVQWGRDTWRIDFAPAYRLGPQAQVKLQYSLQHGNEVAGGLDNLLAAQLTLRW